MKFSQAQQKAVLAWGKELHVEDVPSHKMFRAAQKDLLSALGDPTEQQESSRGNVYYLNDIGTSIAKVHNLLISWVSNIVLLMVLNVLGYV